MKLLKSVKLKILLLTVIFISVIFIFPSELFAEIYKFWVDTSHWETKPVEYIESEYWQVTPRQKWIDTSYTINQGYWKDVQQRRWIDTSYTVSQGYWQDYTYNVWVTSGYRHYYTAQRWVDTSRWETGPRVWINGCHAILSFFIIQAAMVGMFTLLQQSMRDIIQE